MELNNIFEVKAPIEEAWVKLTDLELIAPAMPGAQLEEVEGDEYRGTVKVKVGPITAKYKGTAKMTEKDDDAKKAVIDAKGRDTRGQGNANALITAQLTAEGDDVTKVELTTDLTLTGKVAQFARGVLADVSTKLIGQFVENLESDVFTDGDAATEASSTKDATAPLAKATNAAAESDTITPPSDDTPPESDETDSGVDDTSSDGDKPSGTAEAAGTTADEKVPATPTTEAQPHRETGGSAGPRKINSAEAEAVDLLDSAGAPLAKRVLPALGVLGIILLIIRILRNRSSD